MSIVAPRAAAIVVCFDPKVLRSWCDDMCSGPYHFEVAEIEVPKIGPEDNFDTYVVYFSRRVDCEMFHNAFKADMRITADLALTVEG